MFVDHNAFCAPVVRAGGKTRCRPRHLLLLVLLEGAQVLALLGVGLEASMAVLAGSVDEEQVEVTAEACRGLDGLAQGQWALLGTGETAEQHEPVVADDTVVGEATHGVDALLGQVGGSGGSDVDLTGGDLLAKTVNALVALGTVMVTTLTGAGNLVTHAGRMPGTDTRNLAEATMGLARQALDTPAGDDTLVSVTLGGGQDVDVLALSEHGIDVHLLLEQSLSVGNLVGDGTTVDLDLKDLGGLLAQANQGRLGVRNDTDGISVGGDVLQTLLELSRELVIVGVLGEGLLLGSVPASKTK